jgi:hypothetical protein
MHIFKGKKDNDFRVIRIDELDQHPVEPALYTALFHDPANCEDGSTYFRDNMPKEMEELMAAYPGKELKGLYFQHSALGGRLCAAFFIILSFIFANSWGAKKGEVGDGYAVGQYILAAVSIILLFLVNRKDNS